MNPTSKCLWDVWKSIQVAHFVPDAYCSSVWNAAKINSESSSEF